MVRNCFENFVLKILSEFELKQEPGPASSVVERSLRKISSEGTAVRSPPKEAFSIAFFRN